MKKEERRLKTLPNERGQSGSTLSALSHRVLIVLIAATAVMFGLFYTIGFTVPYEEDVKFNAPMLTDALLIFVYTLLAVAALLVLFGITGLIRRLKR